MRGCLYLTLVSLSCCPPWSQLFHCTKEFHVLLALHQYKSFHSWESCLSYLPLPAAWMSPLCLRRTYELGLIIMHEEGNVKYSCTHLIIYIWCSPSCRFLFSSRKVSYDRARMDLYAYHTPLKALPHLGQLPVWFWGWKMHNLSLTGYLQLVASVQRTIWRSDVIWTIWTAPNCPDQPVGWAAAAVQPHAAQRSLPWKIWQVSWQQRQGLDQRVRLTGDRETTNLQALRTLESAWKWNQTWGETNVCAAEAVQMCC